MTVLRDGVQLVPFLAVWQAYFWGCQVFFLARVVGVMVFELLGGKGLLPATRSTWGTLLGTTAGMIAQFAIGLVMIVWFVAAALFK